MRAITFGKPMGIPIWEFPRGKIISHSHSHGNPGCLPHSLLNQIVYICKHIQVIILVRCTVNLDFKIRLQQSYYGAICRDANCRGGNCRYPFSECLFWETPLYVKFIPFHKACPLWRGLKFFLDAQISIYRYCCHLRKRKSRTIVKM